MDADKEDADLAWMRGLAAALPGANVYGRLRLPPGLTASIQLRGFDKYDAVPDDQGQYTFPAVAPGKYVISATMPSGFTTIEPQTVEVVDKGCAEVNWPIYYDSHIRGRVTDASGRPVPGLPMELQLRDNEHDQSTGGAGSQIQMSDANGQFDFRRVPPGDYLVAANPQGPSPTRPYPRVYYSNKGVDTEATMIHLTPSTTVKDIDIVLPNAWKRVPVHARVLLPDGSSAVGANISARDIDL
jgi:hypothetical protein